MVQGVCVAKWQRQFLSVSVDGAGDVLQSGGCSF